MKRRTFLASGLALPLFSDIAKADPVATNSDASIGSNVPIDDASFLLDLQRRTYQYFVEAADPKTGFVSDRASTDGSWASPSASSAACGFGLAAHSVAVGRGLATRDEAVVRVRRLLDSLVNIAPHERGFVYHFFGARDGVRAHHCEASSVDTALMIAGAMTAAMTFADDSDIVSLADQLYRRVDWNWMLDGQETLSMGWTPEVGMLPYRWDSYSEGVILILLAIGAPENAIPPSCWQAWRREPVLSFQGQGFLTYPPLFVHQYPMAFFDFRDVRSPSGRDYWDNATRAHHAQIDFMTRLGQRYPDQFGHYGAQLWGLTSSDSVDGYRDWGGPYQPGRFEPDRGIDGSVVPSAAAGGLAIVPEQALQTLRHQHAVFGDTIYGRYGFTNAHNPATGWIGSDVIGIDTGISMIMAENLQSGAVWNAFMSHPAAKRALTLARFTPT